MTIKVSPHELAAAFKRQFELCALAPGEVVIFLTDRGADREVVSAGLSMAAAAGNIAYEIRIDTDMNVPFMGLNPLQGSGIIEALKQADLVVCFFVGFFSGWHGAVREAGGRILNVLDDREQLLRLQGTPELRVAARAARDRVRRTKRVRVTSEAGTDFTWLVDQDAPVLCHYGAADEAGQMDHWGQGMVAMFPVEGTAEGRVMVQPGDLWILPYQRLVQSPIDLSVQEGFIRGVAGGVDAKLFRYWLDSCKLSADDNDPYAISHLGWGLNPKARWDDIIAYNAEQKHLLASARAFPGNFLFSTGPGYRRKTKGHIDMPMCDCTISLDGEVVVRNGQVVDPSMIVDPARTHH